MTLPRPCLTSGVKPMTESSQNNGLTRKIELWVIRTRLEQGLPPHVQDVETLQRVIQLLSLQAYSEESERKTKTKQSD
jgi:hypothetical protein